jgi:hypothetical protein
MSVITSSKGEATRRKDVRTPQLSDLTMDYEGSTEHIHVRPPDLSASGMFVNTDKFLPNGAILNLTFRLARTGAVIHARCEVRYCLKGVGVGVEFIDLAPQAEIAIKDEIAAQSNA